MIDRAHVLEVLHDVANDAIDHYELPLSHSAVDFNAAVDEIAGYVHFVWRDLENLLEEHYPEDIFPVLPDDEERDLGPRLLSLVRLLHRYEAKLAAISEIISTNDEYSEIRSVLEREDLTSK